MDKKYKALIGMNYEEITLSNKEYNTILDYGKCKSDSTFTVKLKNGSTIDSKYIDDIEEFIDGKYYKCIGCDCDCNQCEEL